MRLYSAIAASAALLAFSSSSEAQTYNYTPESGYQLVKVEQAGPVYQDYAVISGSPLTQLLTSSDLSEPFTAGIYRSLFYYNLALLPDNSGPLSLSGLNLVSATLTLTPVSNNGSSSSVGAIKDPWSLVDTDQLIYTRAGDLTSAQNISAAAPINTPINFDVTTLVDSWLSAPSSNYGFGLVSNSEGTDPARAFGFDPVLTLEFEEVPVAMPEPGTAGVLLAAGLCMFARRSRR